MTFSVVIPSHRRVDLLERCLRAATAFDAEIIVVDDGSVEACVTRLARQFAQVHIVRHEQPRGFCAAANAGIAAAACAIVALLNDDGEPLPGWDAALAEFRDPAVGAVASLVFLPDGRVDSAGDEYDLGGFARKRGRGRGMSPELLAPRDVFGASGSSLFVRRELFTQLGGFPEQFGAYFEDVDLAFRMKAAGYRVRYCPASRTVHHCGASHGRPRGALLRQQSANEERVWWRNLTPAQRWRWGLRHAAVLLAKAGRRLAEGNLGPWLLGRFDAIFDTVRPNQK